MESRFPHAACPRCETWGQLYTVPLRLVSAGGTAWRALCDECYRQEPKMEPWDDLLMRLVQHGGRRSKH
jgi:hypothetical protein